MPIDTFDITLGPGEGRTVDLGDVQIIFKAVSADTGGAYTLAEYIGAPGSGSQPHTQSREDESFYILEGAMTFQLGEREFEATAGSYVVIPKGLRHAFVNAGPGPVRAVMLFTPAGLERFFEELVELSDQPEGASQEQAQELASRYGLDFS
jgi:quercetin dioxygenase-like cupin family protein